MKAAAENQNIDVELRQARPPKGVGLIERLRLAGRRIDMQPFVRHEGLVAPLDRTTSIQTPSFPSSFSSELSGPALANSSF